jgi:hypothetical protein
VLSATGLMDEAADLVLLTFPKSPNPTVIPILFPEQGIDVSLGIEGRNKIISMARRAVGKLPGTGKIEQDTIEVDQFGKRSHGAIPQ